MFANALLLSAVIVASPESASSGKESTRSPLRIELPVRLPRCQQSREENEVVVCGRGRDDTYRIDQTILAAIRRREQANARNPHANRDAARQTPCGAAGPFTCTGQAGISLIGLGNLAVKIIKGESIRDEFIQEPDEYTLYESERASSSEK